MVPHASVTDFQAAGDPVISIDTKKKELIGDFKNAGKEWQPKGVPEKIRVDDFIDLELGKVAPYGVYDLSTNTGWVSVASTTTPPGLPWKAFDAGGAKWVGLPTRGRIVC